MDYETVDLDEKKIAGLCVRTNNLSTDVNRDIGGLWEKFLSGGVYSAIAGKTGAKALGVYMDYAGDEKGDYNFLTACEVSKTDSIPHGVVIKTIPAGKYAKFTVKGNMVKAVVNFWTELWSMDLPRSFICDFEEYQNADMQNSEIHIYIGLK